MPDCLPELVRARLANLGVHELYGHQAEAIDHAMAGRHVVVATGTASGKSYCYLLPIFARLLTQPRATALYLSPTKALAADQLRAIRSFALTQVRAATFDGDTPASERNTVRRVCNFVLSNPDMLHANLLPTHARWADFLANLSFVVVDEVHTLRGIFGSHVALVLRRLRRLARRYGADPVFCFASATIGNPGEHAARLAGLEHVEEVTQDASPRGEVLFGFWEPPLTDAAAGIRRSSNAETADLLAELVRSEVRTIVFTKSRKASELVASFARRRLESDDPALAGRVRAYRAGYLPEERRALETALVSGDLLAVAATTALELGMDVGGLDVAILNGFPGTIAATWQQAGRAGRRGRGALAILVGADDPLDAYFLHHPSEIFGRPHEAAVIDPSNPHLLGPHLLAACYEDPLPEDEVALSFGPSAPDLLERLAGEDRARTRAGRWFAAGRGNPGREINLRSAGGPPISIVESGTGVLLGTVDSARSHLHVHDGAVYLHQGESFVVEKLDLERRLALVRSADVDYYTSPRHDTDVEILSEQRKLEWPRASLSLGKVAVTTQVTGYERRRQFTGELLAREPLDLPPQTLDTVALWYTFSEDLLGQAGIPVAAIPGAAHAAEHAGIGMLPLVAMCDRWDVGGLSTPLHQGTGLPTIFIHDGYPGGAGIAERGFAAWSEHLAATLAAVRDCPCEIGCPSCVQSPKCGNGNEPLDKHGAVRLLDALIRETSGKGAQP